MAIREVVENGQKFFEVYVDVKSKFKKSARIQKRRKQIRGLREAQQIEKQMISEASMELARLEDMTMSWGELLDTFEVTLRSGTATRAKMQTDILREMVSFLRAWTSDWYKRDCRDITPGDVRRIINVMEEKDYSRGRLRSMKSAINNVFRFGIDEGHLNGVHASPAQSVQLPKYIEDKPPQILGMAEIHRLLETAKAEEHPWYPIWFMALNTGMRSGELYALEWTDLDWEKKLVTVSKSWNCRLKSVKSTKAGYWRKVPMNAELEAMLMDLREKTPITQKNVLPRASRWGNGEAAKFLRDHCLKIGITSVNFHALRACFATHLLNAGVSSPIVKKICGWTEEKVMNRYIRLAGLDVAGATEALKFPGFSSGGSQPMANVVNLGDMRALKRGSPVNGGSEE